MRILIVVLFVCSIQSIDAQKYFSKSGTISFFSDAPLEKIEAKSTTASTVIDATNGSMEWGVLIQGFQFEKALMQEHFNENYMESGKYPKAKFKGVIENWSTVDLNKDGFYPVKVSGTLEIHGVSKPITCSGRVHIKDGALSVSSGFSVLLADYNIEVPNVVANNISKTVDVKVSADYQLMK